MINLTTARIMARGDEDREREILEEMLDREREEEPLSDDIYETSYDGDC